MAQQIIRAKARGLLLHIFDQFGALNSMHEARKILDESCDTKLPPGLMSFNNQGFKVGTRRIDCGRKAGAARAQNDHVTYGIVHFYVKCPWR